MSFFPVFTALLVVLLLLELTTYTSVYFELANVWGFHIWFGLGMTALSILCARLVYAVIHREGTYYD